MKSPFVKKKYDFISLQGMIDYYDIGKYFEQVNDSTLLLNTYSVPEAMCTASKCGSSLDLLYKLPKVSMIICFQSFYKK